MTISSSLMFDRSASRMSALMTLAAKQNTQIATQKKYATASENATVAQQVAEFDRKDTEAATYAANMNLADNMLKQADTTLGSMIEQMQRASTLVTQASNGTLNPGDRKIIGKELSVIVDALVGLGNSKDTNGRPLFGSESGQDAVTLANGVYTSNAAPSLSEVPIGDGLTVQPTETAARIFGSDDNNILNKLTTLANALMTDGDPGGEKSRAALDTINDATDQMSGVQSSIGARGARIDLQQTLQAAVNTDRAELRSSMEDTDLTQTAADFAKTMAVLNATQASFAKLSQLSLFTYLR